MMRCHAKRARASARSSLFLGVAAAGLMAACSSDDGMDPEDPVLALTVVSGDQVAATGQIAPEPLAVRVTDAGDGEPVEDATVTWTVVEGGGARAIPAMSTSDSLGVASTLLELGTQAGDYVVRASTADAMDDATITVRAFSSAPVLTSLSPSAAASGETVTIAGTGFSDRAEDNAVFFGPSRALVQSATPTQLVVIVPPCMATATVDVTARLGPLVSNALSASITGDPQAALQLALGESRLLTSAAALDCLALPGDGGEEFLVVVQNQDIDPLDAMAFRLAGQLEAPPTTLTAPFTLVTASRAIAAAEDEPAQDRFERRLRALEHTLTRGAALAARPPLPEGAAASVLPALGAADDFQVFNGDGFTTVTAEVVFTSTRALIYEDLNVPAGGFSAADYAAFAAEFDDPIYDTDVDAFGAPSDIDGNGRVIILFTPVVNQLTPPNSDGFVAGFFFGLDLTSLAGSNEAEIFYSVVPDPTGQFGDARSRERILEVVPPVLAHEFQHMIHFNERRLVRGGGSEALWLSEGLAHVAESLVADVFRSRGNVDRAFDYESANLARALRYLRDPEDVRLVVAFGDGTLAERGAGWMFVQYLGGHFGGATVLGNLTRTTATGVANVTSTTGDTWSRLLAGWLAANYADNAPELPSGPTDPRDSYPNMNLRADFQALGLSYPLSPFEFAFSDFILSGELPSSAGRYVRFDAGSGSQELRMRLTSEGGEPFEAGSLPAISVLRLR